MTTHAPSSPQRQVADEAMHPTARDAVAELQAIADQVNLLFHRAGEVLDRACPPIVHNGGAADEWNGLHIDHFDWDERGVNNAIALYSRAGIELREHFEPQDIAATVQGVGIPAASRAKIEHVRDIAAAIRSLGGTAIETMKSVDPKAVTWHNYETAVREPVNAAASAIIDSLDGVRFLAVKHEGGEG